MKETALKIKTVLYQETNPDPYTEVKNILGELEDKYPVLHIGKRSGGWKFLFAPNPKYYNETKESIDKFLNRPDVSIWDEYGNEILPFEFWEDYGNQEGYTLKTYWEAHNQYSVDPDSYEHITEEGLRFSNKDDFS